MDPALLAFGGGAAAFVALLVWLGKRGSAAAKERQAANAQALEALKAKGWTMGAAAPTLVDLGRQSPFRDGRERRASNAIKAKYEQSEFVSFEYEYVTEYKDQDGKVQRTDHKYNVIGFKIAGEIDGIRIMPEGLWDGKYDLDVESDDFNKKWRVLAKDKRMAHALLSPTVIELLVSRDTEKMPIIFEPGYIWTYRAGETELAKLEARLAVLAGVAREIPPFVYKEAKAGAAPDKYQEPAALVDDPRPATPSIPTAGVGTPGGRSVGGGGLPRATGRSAGATGAPAGGAAGANAGRRSPGGTAPKQAQPKATGRSAGGTGRAAGGSASGGTGSGGAGGPGRGGRSPGGTGRR